jgi:ABC-2 type transport system permease protein
MMLRGLWKLTWIELKVFMREPLGAFGTIGVPVLIFIVVGHVANLRFGARSPSSISSGPSFADVPVFVAILIAISAVISLVTIISIYREGGILKRLRATPLRPQTILSAHVIVKLLLTTATLVLMFLSGKRYFPPGTHVPWFSFTVALLISTWSILSVGFVIASIVPTARFAQPIGAVILYPMIAFCGLFVPISHLPPMLRAVAHLLPLTYAVRLLQGIWIGDGWLAHLSDVAALIVMFLLFTAVSAKIFRWE